MILKIVLLAILLLLPVNAYTEEDGILVLTDEDLPTITSQFPHLFVKYYVPWCRHCQQLAPIYKDIARELQGMNSTIRLAKINCEENQKAYEFENIQHFPTLMFYNKGEPLNFDGDRTKGYILKWLTKRLVSPVREVSREEYEGLKVREGEEVGIVFHGELESVKGATFTNIAYQDNYNSYYFVREPVKPYGTVELFRSFAEDVEYPYPDDSFPSWIAEHDRPAVVPLDDRSISSLFRDGKVGALLFLQSKFAQRRREFAAAAEAWKSKNEKARLIFVDVPEEHEDYFGLLEYMDVNPRETPVVIINAELQHKYLLEVPAKDLGRDKIVEFLNAFAEGKIVSSPLESEHAHNHDHDHDHDHDHHHGHDHHHHHHHHQHHDHHEHHHGHHHDHDQHDHDHSNCGHDHSHDHEHSHTHQHHSTQTPQPIPEQSIPEVKAQQEVEAVDPSSIQL